MRKSLAVGIAASVCLLWSLQIAQAAGKIRWRNSLPAALTEAKQANKLILLDFYTDWWGYCKKLDRETYTSAQVIQLSGQVVPVKLNAEKEGRSAAQKYGVTGYPTILFLSPQGAVTGRIGGYLPAAPFAAAMKQQISAFRETPVLEARIRANPADTDTAARLSVIYANQGKKPQAEAMLGRAAKGNGASGHLAKAYNAVADTYQEAGQFDKAISLFKKAAQTGKQPGDIAYAHISIGACYLSQGKFKQAIPPLEATLAVPNAPTQLKSGAQQMLAMARQRAK